MFDINQILTPTDFSKVSLAALAFAKSLAERFSAELFVVHIADDPLLNAPTTSDDYRETYAKEQEQRLRALFTPAEMESLRPVLAVRNGSATEELLAAVAEYGVDLVVMGMQGHSALANMLLGSVCESMLRKCPCPVVTVRAPK